MKLKNKILISLFFVIILLLTYLESKKASPLNWFPSYSKTDKIPLGTYVFYELFKEIKPRIEMQDINIPPYEFLSKTDTIHGTYMFVNNKVNFDASEIKYILKWVEKGNTLFISANEIGENILDSLKLKTTTLGAIEKFRFIPYLNLCDPKLKKKIPYSFDQNSDIKHFNKIDTLNTVVLGTVTASDVSDVSDKENTKDNSAERDIIPIALADKEDNSKINYLKQSYGKGTIYLHTLPEAFSNYFILKDSNNKYTESVIAYIDPDKPLYWDNFHKSGKTIYTSPLYLILSNSYLKTAYYFLIFGVVLFILFESKRKQRSIPIIYPLQNQSLSFTQTISNLYLKNKKPNEIVNKQYALFLEYIRSELRIPTDQLNAGVIESIAARSNNSLKDTQDIFSKFTELKQKEDIKNVELVQLYQQIFKFKNGL